jgi:biopolymer transport protein TolQ
LNTSFLIANIVFDAYRTSSVFNKLVVVLLVLLSIYTLANMVGKRGALNIIDRRNLRFLRQLRGKPHPAQHYIDVKGKFMPGTPMADIYSAAIKEMLSLLRKRGVLETDVAGWSAGLAPVALSEYEIDAIRSCADSELEEQLIIIEDKMSSLATSTSIAPSLGLFGTVWGVMEAFMAMADSGSTMMITNVAPGIAGALLTTVIGLFIAIPATWAYNGLADRVRFTSVKVRNFTDQLVADIAHQHVRPDATYAPRPSAPPYDLRPNVPYGPRYDQKPDPRYDAPPATPYDGGTY